MWEEFDERSSYVRATYTRYDELVNIEVYQRTKSIWRKSDYKRKIT